MGWAWAALQMAPASFSSWQAGHTEAGRRGSQSPTESDRGPGQGQQEADGPCPIEGMGLGLNSAFRVSVIDVAAHGPSIHSLGSEEDSIARLVAIGLAIMLCMPSWCQCLGTALTAQAWPVPVLAQRRHFLSKVDPLVAARTQVRLPGERGHTGGSAGPPRRATSLPFLSTGCRGLDGASDQCTLRDRLLIDVGACATNVHTFGSKQRGIAGLVAEGLSIVLCMAPWCQSLAAALTLETERVVTLLFPESQGLMSVGHYLSFRTPFYSEINYINL